MGSDRCSGDRELAEGRGGWGDGGRATAEEQWCGLGSALEMLTLSWHHGSVLHVLLFLAAGPASSIFHVPAPPAALRLFWTRSVRNRRCREPGLAQDPTLQTAAHRLERQTAKPRVDVGREAGAVPWPRHREVGRSPGPGSGGPGEDAACRPAARGPGSARGRGSGNLGRSSRTCDGRGRGRCCCIPSAMPGRADAGAGKWLAAHGAVTAAREAAGLGDLGSGPGASSSRRAAVVHRECGTADPRTCVDAGAAIKLPQPGASSPVPESSPAVATRSAPGSRGSRPPPGGAPGMCLFVSNSSQLAGNKQGAGTEDKRTSSSGTRAE